MKTRDGGGRTAPRTCFNGLRSAPTLMSTGHTPASPPWHSSPVRAITSTLSARAAPPVPPASQTYEPLARAVLRRRLLYDILPLSTLPVWTSTIFWKMWNVGGLSALGILNSLIMPIHPSTLLMTTLVWGFGVLPLIVLRKSQLTGKSVDRNLWIRSYLPQLFPLHPPLPHNASKLLFLNLTHFVLSQCTFSQTFSFQYFISYLAASLKLLPAEEIILEFLSNRSTYSPSRYPLQT